MRRFIITTLLLVVAAAAQADLQFHGGPVLKSFEIIPYYYGPWDAAKIDEHQKYLVGLAQYISGANAPAKSQPTLVQYGVTSAGAHAPITKTAGVKGGMNLSNDAALKIVHDAQAAGTVPAYAPNRLILLLLPTGSTFSAHCAYHGSEAVGKYYAFVSQDCGPWLEVTAHEVFEAATDPAINQQHAWDEAVDPCSTAFKTWFGDVPGSFDNSIHACSNTGYDTAPSGSVPGSFTAVWSPSTTPEIQMDGVSYDTYRARYDELWNVGWRLSILQPYVAGGQLRYNAVWRPSTEAEIQVYGWTYDDYRKKYDALWPQGWRLAILQPYVLNGDVRYTAVWRSSTEGEIQLYGWTYADYRKKYDDLWKQGWRLKLIQPYVINGDVRYTAVFRPSTDGEIQVYGWAYPDYRKKYDELWKQGWRLKLLSIYLKDGQARYTAAWRPANNGEIQVYAWAYDDYRTKYDSLLPDGLRLQSLQAH